MGCGSSLPTAQGAVQDPHPVAGAAVPAAGDPGELRAVVGAGAELVAGVAASAAVGYVAAAVVTGCAAGAGEALLSLGAQLPWISPCAFLIGAVIKAASQVRALKADAAAFSRVVRSVEAVLNEAALAGTLSKAYDWAH